MSLESDQDLISSARLNFQDNRALESLMPGDFQGIRERLLALMNGESCKEGDFVVFPVGDSARLIKVLQANEVGRETLFVLGGTFTDYNLDFKKRDEPKPYQYVTCQRASHIENLNKGDRLRLNLATVDLASSIFGQSAYIHDNILEEYPQIRPMHIRTIRELHDKLMAAIAAIFTQEESGYGKLSEALLEAYDIQRQRTLLESGVLLEEIKSEGDVQRTKGQLEEGRLVGKYQDAEHPGLMWRGVIDGEVRQMSLGLRMKPATERILKKIIHCFDLLLAVQAERTNEPQSAQSGLK